MDFDKLNINGVAINRSKEIKYLGVYLDEKLSFRTHVDFLCKSLLKYFGMFNRIKLFLTRQLCRNLYYAFIYSKIQYCIEIYGSCSTNLLSKVQTLQNKLLKLLTRKH